MLLPYWDHSGKFHQLEAFPQSFHDWTRGEDVPADHKELHDAVKAILDQALVRTSCKAQDMNLTLDATLDDGRSVILRRRHSYLSDPNLEQWSLVKFKNEIGLLRWLRDNSSIPVPRILAVGANFTIQEKMPGSALAYQWHSLSESAKDNLLSGYINVLLELFHLPVPQCIRSALVDEINNIDVGPLVGANPSYSIPMVIEDISDYVRFLFTAKRQTIQEMNPDNRQRAEANLYLYYGLLAAPCNITAVLDWEINCIQPAIFGVDYPLWLSTRGPHNAQFASRSHWWEESPAECDRLCALYEEKIQERDPELYKCLIEGRDLRAIVSWLKDTLPDPGFDRMATWATAQLG